MGTLIHSILILSIFHYCVCPPVTKKAPSAVNPDTNENEVDHLEAMGIEYNRYLKQVVEALESDADFRRKLENAQEADIRSGKIAEELDYVNHHVRTKLDELKRQELQRLRNLAKLETAQDDSARLKPPEHLDHANPNSFEIADLHKLIRKVTEDLEEADRKRKEEFKQYEMQKEFELKEKMKTMDEEQQKKYKEELEEMKKKHQKHEPLHHPGSKQQLEEVWEKQDHMEQQEFDPKTFFYLHDLDGNGFWDQEEVKALFLKELDKLYQAGVPEDDMRERAEEMERMREHVFKETDTDRDGLISFKEFLYQTKKPEFEKDQGWETLDQQQVYTPEEYAEFERRRQLEIQRLISEGRLPPHPQGMAPRPGYHAPNQHPYQHPQQMGQPQYAPQGQPQYAPQGHPQYAAAQHPNNAYQHYPDQQYAPQQQYHYQQQPNYQQHQAYPQQPIAPQPHQQGHHAAQPVSGGQQHVQRIPPPAASMNQPSPPPPNAHQQVHQQPAAAPAAPVHAAQVPPQPVAGQNPQQPNPSADAAVQGNIPNNIDHKEQEVKYAPNPVPAQHHQQPVQQQNVPPANEKNVEPTIRVRSGNEQTGDKPKTR